MRQDHPPRPKKYRGQNFLRDRRIARRIVEAAEIMPGDLILEIGAGRGELTLPLAEKGTFVLAVEVDRALAAFLKERLRRFPRVKIARKDILQCRLSQLLPATKTKEGRAGKFKVIGNLPYYITSDIIVHLLRQRTYIYSILVTVQREVAERLVAPPGGRKRGRLSCLVQYYTKPEMLFSISRKDFYPQPKVDSALLRMTVLPRPVVPVKNEGVFFRVIEASFAKRRKTLLNCLSAFSDFGPGSKSQWKNLLEDLEVDPQRRAETLSISEFARISDKLSEFKK